MAEELSPITQNAFGRELTALGFRKRKNGTMRTVDVRLVGGAPRVVAYNKRQRARSGSMAPQNRQQAAT